MKFGFIEATGFIAGLVGGSAAFSVMAGEAAVSIDKYAFSPKSLTVKVGTTVVWTNNEKRTGHDVTIPDLGAASERLMGGDVFKFTFDKPGRYAYVCEIHKNMPDMQAEIVVEE